MGRKAPRTLNFTKAGIEGLPLPVAGREYHYDDKIPGLAICVTSAGNKTFYLVRRIGTKVERIRLGPWPGLTVERARTMAAQFNGQIASGLNPSDTRREVRQAPTLAQVFAEFIELPTRTKSKRPKSDKTVEGYRLQFARYLADWHGRRISTITRQDVEKLHNHLATSIGHHTANRVLALIKALLNCSIDLGYLTANPAMRLMPFEELSRERYLRPDELPRFWQALEAEPCEATRDLFKVALFTGQRRGNVLAMRWDDLHLDRGVWTIPRTKTGRHTVPLTEAAVAILSRRRRNDMSGEYVFPGRYGRGHLTDPIPRWKALMQRAGIEDLRIHDLRRSLASWQANTGATLQVVGRTLGHASPETTAIYSRVAESTVRTAMETAVHAILAATKPAG